MVLSGLAEQQQNSSSSRVAFDQTNFPSAVCSSLLRPHLLAHSPQSHSYNKRFLQVAPLLLLLLTGCCSYYHSSYFYYCYCYWLVLHTTPAITLLCLHLPSLSSVHLFISLHNPIKSTSGYFLSTSSRQHDQNLSHALQNSWLLRHKAIASIVSSQ